jgi:hypothetical protein
MKASAIAEMAANFAIRVAGMDWTFPSKRCSVS